MRGNILAISVDESGKMTEANSADWATPPAWTSDRWTLSARLLRGSPHLFAGGGRREGGRRYRVRLWRHPSSHSTLAGNKFCGHCGYWPFTFKPSVGVLGGISRRLSSRAYNSVCGVGGWYSLLSCTTYLLQVYFTWNLDKYYIYII